MERWKELLQQEEQKEYYRKLMQLLDEEYAHRTIYPPRGDLLIYFTSCPFEAVKMVMLGQDPYHQPDQARGPCFSIRKDVQISRSLKNIHEELKSDMNIDVPPYGCLTDWAKQGVFLMNMVMSIQEGQAVSRKKEGQKTFTDTVTLALDEQEKGIVFVLQRSHVQKKTELVTGRQHRILMSTCPSPLSAFRGFFDSRPFSTANRCSEEIGRIPTDWRLSE